MATFRSLAELQKYLENNVAETLARSMDVERVLSDAVVESVIKNVYEAYTPKEYERRGEDGGLADARNYSISDVKIIGSKIFLQFENLATGNDNMKNEFIADLIENDKDPRWNRQGEWSEARPFMKEAQEYLKQNPAELVEAIKNGLRQKGMKVR